MVSGPKIETIVPRFGRTISLRGIFLNFRMRDSHARFLLKMNVKSFYIGVSARGARSYERALRLMFGCITRNRSPASFALDRLRA
jgi:hypothetical protein